MAMQTFWMALVTTITCCNGYTASEAHHVLDILIAISSSLEHINITLKPGL